MTKTITTTTTTTTTESASPGIFNVDVTTTEGEDAITTTEDIINGILAYPEQSSMPVCDIVDEVTK